jgi:hypothetical protein
MIRDFLCHSVTPLWGIDKSFNVFSSILRSIEFPSIGPGGPSGETSKSLEMLLLERTKALQQAENAALKAAADLQGNGSTVDTTRLFYSS